MDKKLISSITPDSLKGWPEGSVAIVANDAGAARLLFSWLEALDHQLNICATGPALAIVRREMPTKTIFSDPKSCIKGCRLLISGTGWSSNIEHASRLIAAEQNIPSIAVLDHWVNYQERFVRNGHIQLADTLWVSDKEAKQIATILFPEIPITQLQNRWMEDLVLKVNSYRGKFRKRTPSDPAKSLLYLTEPTRDRVTGEQTHEELEYLEYWISQLPKLISKGWIDANQAHLKIRAHPSEPLKQYRDWINKYKGQWPISIDEAASLEISLAQADLTFGHETQALVAAICCGIKAISCHPPNTEPGRLPHKDIIKLK